MTLKYEQIIISIKRQIADGELRIGSALPSINAACSKFQSARETVTKAYKILKKEGLIDSVPGKGFFLIREQSDSIPSVLLMLNSFNPYMQVLYYSIKRELGVDYNLDVYFHHHNLEVFRSLIEKNSGKYDSYIIKPFDHPEVAQAMERLKGEYLLLLDRDDCKDLGLPGVYQNFSEGFGKVLAGAHSRMASYRRICLVQSKYNPHPLCASSVFSAYADSQGLSWQLISGDQQLSIEEGNLYIVFSDRELLEVLSQAQAQSWVPGRDFGLISYNDNPINQFISAGISAISVDFAQMGKEAARKIRDKSREVMYLDPALKLRSSF